jgi:putative FmdB family regulatory protein
VPIFEFKCMLCDDISEEITSDREKVDSVCPKCGALSNKIMSVVGWDIKGGGVYRTCPPATIPKK